MTAVEDMVSITVDGLGMEVPKGTLLWEACKAHGIDIPIFCYHTKLGPVGACRTCLVEVEGMPKGPITACSTPVTDGMIVRTRSPVVEKAQRGIFEFLLLNHPLDCPICDRAGECPLQDQTFAYGPGSSRYIEPKRHHVKPIVLGPTIALDRERCVLCWRCVRFCSEIAEDKSIILQDRADHTIVGTFHDQPYVSNFSGNVVELCPVGALTSRKQRFNFRPWELENRPTICPHCPMGCNINISVRKNDEVIRFLSRDNPEVDDSWLCDRGRYGFEFINSPQRLSSPLIRRGDGFVESSWSEALDLIAARLRPVLEESGPDSAVGIASPRMTNEDLFVFKRFMQDVIGTSNHDYWPRPLFPPGAEYGDAAARLDRAVVPIADLDKARTIVILGADPSEREPVMELRIRLAINRHGARLVVVNNDEITLSSKADRIVSYEYGRMTELTRELTRAVVEARSGTTRQDAIGEIANVYLMDGPVAVLYDDSFPGVEAKGDALVAVADFVEALGSDAGSIPMLDAANSMGARDLRVIPDSAVSATQQLLSPDSQIRTAFLAGSNLARDLPDEATQRRLDQLDLLVVQELFLTETARLADVILPVSSFAEKIGTFTNTERRVQLLRQTVPSPGIARPDWQIMVDLSQHFEHPLGYGLPEEVWEDIRLAVPRYSSISYADIGPRGVRPEALRAAGSGK